MDRLDYDAAPGQVFFNDVASDVSCWGTFDNTEDSQVWNDDQIRDYIRGSRPDLFKTLNGLPLRAEGVATNVTLRHDYLTNAECILLLQTTQLLSHQDLTPSLGRHATVTERGHAWQHSARTVELQHQHHIEKSILAGQKLVMRKVQKPGHLVICAAPTCQNAIGKGSFFVTLEASSTQPEMNYGLECLEYIFKQTKRPVRHATRPVETSSAAEAMTTATRYASTDEAHDTDGTALDLQSTQIHAGDRQHSSSDLICYCREHEVDSTLIQCANNDCLIQWFHLDCCAEAQLTPYSPFTCIFCVGTLQQQVVAHHLPLLHAETTQSSLRPCQAKMQSVQNIQDWATADNGQATPNQHNLSLTTTYPTTEKDHAATEASFPSAVNLDGVAEPVHNFTGRRCLSSILSRRNTFADLAPFMSYKQSPPSISGLSDEEALKFEAWRLVVGPSRLLAKVDVIMRDKLPYCPRGDLRRTAGDWKTSIMQPGRTAEAGDLSDWLRGDMHSS